MPNKLPDHAQVVVIGGGIVGCSVAYHLTQLGWTDVVILEKQRLASGTTGHGAGLVTQLRHTRALTDLSRYSADLYPRLEAETGQSSGFRQTGSISVARTPSRMDELRRAVSMARGFGVQIEQISLREAGQMWPLMRTDDLVGAIYIPNDGQTVPPLTTKALAMGATKRGAAVFEDVKVTGIGRRNEAVSGVSTDSGEIVCEAVVNCGGMWAREIGAMCGVSVPSHAADHAYLVTEPMDGVADETPTLRDQDGYIYFRRDIEDTGGLLMGGFDPVARPWGMDGVPDDFSEHLLDRDWSHYQAFMNNAVERVPALRDSEIARRLVGPESFTPDNNYIIGEAPELRASSSPQASTPAASHRRPARARRWPSGWWRVSRRWLSRRSISGAFSGSRTAPDTFTTGPSRASASSTACTGPSDRMRARAGRVDRRCMTGSPLMEPASARSQGGSAQTGSHQRA